MDPRIIASLISTLGPMLGGLFGPGQPQLSPEQQAIYQRMLKLANSEIGFGRTVPLSTVGEQNALAQDRGMLGNFMKSQHDAAAAAFGPGDSEHLADFEANLAGRNTAAMQNVDSQHLIAALAARRSARSNAAGMLQGAGGVAAGPRYQQPMPDMSQLFGSLAQTAAYSQARQRADVRPITGLKTNGAAGGAGGGMPWAGFDPNQYNLLPGGALNTGQV